MPTALKSTLLAKPNLVIYTMFNLICSLFDSSLAKLQDVLVNTEHSVNY